MARPHCWPRAGEYGEPIRSLRRLKDKGRRGRLPGAGRGSPLPGAVLLKPQNGEKAYRFFSEQPRYI